MLTGYNANKTKCNYDKMQRQYNANATQCKYNKMQLTQHAMQFRLNASS